MPRHVRTISPYDVLACVQQQMTAEEAAEHLGFATCSVRDAAGEMGVRFRDPRTPSPSELERMVAMRRDGATYRQIAETVGRDMSGVRKILIRATQENTHV